MITIGTVKFDFKASNEPFALELNKRWDHFFEINFERVMNDVLRFYDLEHEMITIESLPLNLGVMQEDDFDRQFAERLHQALSDYLKKYLSDGKDESQYSVVGIRRTSLRKSVLEIFCFYLLHGYFPYQTETKYMNPSYLLELVISTESYHFREFLEAYSHYEFLHQRLAFQFTDEELERIVYEVRPSESKFVDLYARVRRGTCMADSDALIAKEYQDVNNNNVIDKNSKLKMEGVIMETTMNEFQVNNAGLILFAPFFARLFQITGLMEEHHSFKNEDCQMKAVFMLQYLAYGKEREWEESALVLNKLIVGFEPDKPLPRKVELTDKEKETVDSMFSSVREMWDKLRHTSFEGIRISFLQRNGIVTKEERPGYRMLKVEERAYDILMDYLPWSFRYYKIPWGNTIIETKWRG